jgi:tetratricopeptide (TPR) repeat protein
MRYTLLFISFLLFLTACHHTTPEQKALLVRADSLMEHHSDSALCLLKRIHNYKDLACADRAFYALLMSQALDKNDIKIESDSLIRIATDYYGTGEPMRAGYAWFYLSRCENYRGDFEGRATDLLNAETFATQSNNDYLKGLIYGEKTNLYHEQNQPDSALRVSLLALSAFERSGNKYNIVISLLETGKEYFRKEEYKRALACFQKASKASTQPLDTLLLSTSLRMEAISHYYLGNIDTALNLLYRSIAISTDSYSAGKYMNMGMIYKHKDQYDSAVYYLHKSLQSGGILNNRRDCYEMLAQLEATHGNFSGAYQYSIRYAEIIDSIRSTTLSTSFAGMEKKYNYGIYVAENKSLIIANQRIKIVVLLLLLGLSFLVVILLIRKNRHKQQQLAQQQALIDSEVALSTKEKENNTLLKKQLEIQQMAVLITNQHKKSILSQGIHGIKNRANAQQVAEKEQTLFMLYSEVINSVDKMYHSISKRLAAHYSELSENDILICCLLLAGFDSASIASLFDIQLESFNTRRTRLRKKMNLSHEDNLTDFLAKF